MIQLVLFYNDNDNINDNDPCQLFSVSVTEPLGFSINGSSILLRWLDH